MQTEDQKPAVPTAEATPLTLDEYTEIIYESENQPYWRSRADKEMDYADGNQLDSELLRRQRQLGVPPAVEDLIGPALLSIQGYEAKTRTDWRVTPNGQPGGQEIADAINFKLNQAERQSKADEACTEAFRPQIGVGLGWVEVSRDSDPFAYPYRCTSVHRNEVWWDMKAKKKDLTDSRWLRRKRWIHPERVASTFPQHAEVIRAAGNSGTVGLLERADMAYLEGGQSTGLMGPWAEARGWTMMEDSWYNPASNEVGINELWYRRWVRVPVMFSPDGRVVEYDEGNPAHVAAVASGRVKVKMATVTRIRRSYWLGPLVLFDGPTPYTHRHFPYVPFWGFREDSTNIPYGYIRGMVYSQDSVNSGTSKLRWGMSVARVERTKGAVDMTDEQLRRQIARPDADIVLNAEAMARTGARFDVKRDYTLTDQHFQLLNDARSTIQRVSAVTAGFMGRQGTATSGLQEQTQVEQSNQSLGVMMDNFRTGRTMVGELLMSMIVEDMGDQLQTIIIEGDAVREDRAVTINKPEVDPETGIPYLSNDLQRTRLKVSLEDVPSTNSYRAQQLNSLSEAVKSLPAQYQAAVLPFMVSLMDVPFKQDVVKSIKEVSAQQTPEQIEARIKEEVKQALLNAGHDLKARELELKERKGEAEIQQIMAQAVQTGVQAAFAAMQAGTQIAQMPQIAPVADAIMQGAGYKKPAGGQDPNFPTAAETAAVQMKDPYVQGQGRPLDVPQVHHNTSPTFPPIPSDGKSPMTGIETATPADNFQGAEQ
jgi:hypothetical protein